MGESPEWAQYDGWRMYTQAGDFYAKAGDESAFRANLARLGGEGAVADWKRLRQFIQPLGKAVLALPPIALRKDPGVLSLALPWLPKLADPRIGLRAYLLSVRPTEHLSLRLLLPLSLSPPPPLLPKLCCVHRARGVRC